MREHLERFKEAHQRDYATALAEIRSGRKKSHWMWYIFPQIHDLGFSSISQFYAIQNLREAREYLNDSILGTHLEEISTALLALKTDDPHEVFGSPDDMKLCSCMTLFEKADPGKEIFSKVMGNEIQGPWRFFEARPRKHSATGRSTTRQLVRCACQKQNMMLILKNWR